jgi:hypothetical protein
VNRPGVFRGWANVALIVVLSLALWAIIGLVALTVLR